MSDQSDNASSGAVLPLLNSQKSIEAQGLHSVNMPFNQVSGLAPSPMEAKTLPNIEPPSLATAPSSAISVNIGRITYNRPLAFPVKSPSQTRPQPKMTLADYNRRLRSDDE